MSPLFAPIRSPSHKASGLRPDAVRCLRLRSVAFFQFVGPAEEGCRPSCRSVEQITLRGLRLAGRTFAYLRAIAQACRPVPSPSLSYAGLMIQPGPGRVVVPVCAFSSVHAQGPCLRVDDQSTMDRLACASTNPGRFIQEAAA